MLVLQAGHGVEPVLAEGVAPPGRVLLRPRVEPRDHRVQGPAGGVQRNPRLAHAGDGQTGQTAPGFGGRGVQQLRQKAAAQTPQLLRVKDTAAVRQQRDGRRAAGLARRVPLLVKQKGLDIGGSHVDADQISQCVTSHSSSHPHRIFSGPRRSIAAVGPAQAYPVLDHRLNGGLYRVQNL